MSLLSLPAELHLQILSHLDTINDQDAASQSFPLWHKILATTDSFVRQRYATNPSKRHRIVVHQYLNTGIPLVVIVDSVESGVIIDWRYIQEKIPGKLEWRNISSSRFLDDPLFAQWDFEKDRAKCFPRSSVDKAENPSVVPTKRDTKAVSTPDCNPTEIYLSPVKTDIQETYGYDLEFTAELHFSEDVYRIFGRPGQYWWERLALGSQTKVKEVITEVVKDVLPALKDWVKGGEEFDISFWGKWARVGSWRLVVSVNKTLPISSSRQVGVSFHDTIFLPEYRRG
ncbi:hypothetical protein TWF106_002192 [Orbilia oligospora]|uniref:F-box domain-containing protein n=1 Tax=Orbilia oligospora TaxID=2813651 RepID=A0A6G1M7G7_ORBOL|nr:hypothetical protein TWF788_001406 [Orbilia oligospora]KAF3219469.1 hypothetical protein TWF679_010937 [Orbilia oligospora]KAF3224516.1 hypothetical protein TWF191_005984 [Orbilia oligospora]KAF3225676.1 hypothetical protein TWF106_002192 [Orbilia oligospora]KAF3248277.1 hypothetical protein TWF192_006274 [Orbilia oligospora]